MGCGGPGPHPALRGDSWGHGQLRPEPTRWTASPSRASEGQLWTDLNHCPVGEGLAGWGWLGWSPHLELRLVSVFLRLAVKWEGAGPWPGEAW